MKSKSFLTAIVSSFLLLACSTSTRITDVYKNRDLTPKQYRTIFIIAMTNHAKAQEVIESNLAEAASMHGYKAIKSTDVFKRTFTKDESQNKDLVMKAVHSLNADAIFTVTLIDKTSETRYVPGSGPYMPYPRFGWYGNFWSYYSHWYPIAYDPGYYTTDKMYYLESNLYDVSSEQLVWSVQSETINPSSLADFSKSYTKALVKALEKDMSTK